MIDRYLRKVAKNRGIEQSVRTVITFVLTFISLFTVIVAASILTVSLVGALKKKYTLNASHNADVLGRSLSQSIRDIGYVAKEPIITSAFISPDVKKVNSILNPLITRTLSKYAMIFDEDGQVIMGVDSKGRSVTYGSHLNKQERFKVLSVKSSYLQVNHNINIAVPIKYYMKTQGYIELNFDPDEIIKSLLSDQYYYEIIARNGHVVFSNVLPDFFLTGMAPIKIDGESGPKLQLAVYSSFNPYVAQFMPLIMFFIPFMLLLFFLSWYISKRISQKMVEPIQRLVEKVSMANDHNEDKQQVKCAPLGAYRELEYLAESFDLRTEALIDINSSLEKKVEVRTLEYQNEKNRAENALKLRSEFIANMSHEIRTPLNGILGMTEILYDKASDYEIKDRLKVIQNSGRLLLSIISDILDFSKIESKKIVLESIPFQIGLVLQDVIFALEPQAEEKNLVLKARFSFNKSKGSLGDPTRLSQILLNVIGNAIKFTESGSITVTVEEVEQVDLHTKFRIAVKDTGIGISEDKRARLFDAFSQADGSITRRFGGSGLGLTISKQLVEMMEGTIEVESKLGEGSEFIITLLFKDTEFKLEKSENRENVAQKNIDTNIKILLAEDNEINQLVAVGFLKSMGLSCDVAKDGLEALELARNNPYDIILMDMQMPNMDGLESTLQIKRLESHKETKIVALTANAFNKDREKCFEVGMVDFISKPLTKKSLRSTLGKWANNE